MRPGRHFGIAMVAVLGLCCPVPPADAWALAGGDAPRITYPAGHYPLLRLPNGETRPIHSLLDISRRLAFGDYVWDAAVVPPGAVWVRVDLASQMLSVFRGSDEIGTAVIIYGTAPKPTPTGVFRILQKSAHYYSRSYDAPMPYALRLTADGVAIHASLVRERSATHGCVGVPLEFARLLFEVVRPGDEVAIVAGR